MDVIVQFFLDKWPTVTIVGFIFYVIILLDKHDIWNTIIQPFYYRWRYRYNLRGNKRQRFAKYIIEELSKSDRLEEWSDYRFSELEAEVEAEDRWWATSILLPFKRKRVGLHREKSLSEALRKSSEKLIFLEGEPGSGKSVALRHLARKMAEDASKTAYPYSLIPLYINLRGLERQQPNRIDRNLLREHVLLSLNRVNDRDVEIFLEQEFSKGLQDNTWLFLFDSFDEIPEILSSTEADKLTVEYASAIEDFMSGMNDCRAIVASRLFRGPSQISWSHFRILPLTEEKQETLIKKAELEPEKEKILLGSLPNSNDDVQRMSSNPMFLGLLCDHIRVGGMFPQNSHSVFESFITTRLRHDEERLHDRFDLDISQVRQVAEKIAFSMTADQMIGLSPTRGELSKAFERQRFNLNDDFYRILDALEYLKIGKSETASIVGDNRQFSFSHRRFQEYFTTCIVLQEPHRVSTEHLLGDARWRETCVTLLHTQSVETNKPIIYQAEKILTAVLQQMQSWEDNNEITFKWPEKCLHTIKLLQDGLSEQIGSIPTSLRQLIRKILIIPYEKGILLDRKLALEVSTLVPDEIFTQMIVAAWKNPSPWLENIAYKQLGSVRQIVPNIEVAIRHMLLNSVRSGNLLRRKNVFFAQVSRLPNASRFQDILKELLFANFMFVVGNILIVLVLLPLFVVADIELIKVTNNLSDLAGFVGADFALLFMFYFFYRTYKTDLRGFMMVNTMYFLFSFNVLYLGLISLNLVFIFFFCLIIWPSSVCILIYRTSNYASPKYWAWSPALLIFDVITSSVLRPLSENIRQVSLFTLLKAFKTVLLFIGFLSLFVIFIFLYGLTNPEIASASPLRTISLFVLWSLITVFVGWGIYRRISLLGVKGAIFHFLDESKWFLVALGDVFVKPFRILHNRLEDDYRYEVFMSELNPKINVYDFLDLVGSQNTKHYPVIVKRVLRENLLRPDPGTIYVLRLFSSDLEDALNFRKENYKAFAILNPNWRLKIRKDPEQYVNWLTRFQKKHRYSLGQVFGYEFLDDLNRLIELIEFGVDKTKILSS